VIEGASPQLDRQLLIEKVQGIEENGGSIKAIILGEEHYLHVKTFPTIDS
jgi:hypothetical protein